MPTTTTGGWLPEPLNQLTGIHFADQRAAEKWWLENIIYANYQFRSIVEIELAKLLLLSRVYGS